MQSLFIGVFADFFGNIINIVFTILFVIVGIAIGVILRDYLFRPKNQVLYCRERDKRGKELNIGTEDPISLETNSSPELRFFKFGGSYEFRKRGRSYTRFFGKEGTAYTWRLQGFAKVPSKFKTVKVKEPVLTKKGEPAIDKKTGNVVFQEVEKQVPIEWEEQKVDLPFPTLEEAVKFRWGDFYETVPDQWQDKLREDQVLLTVGLEPGITPEGYATITESTVEDKADEDAARLWAQSLKGAIASTFMDKLPWIGVGAAAVALGSKLLGWW